MNREQEYETDYERAIADVVDDLRKEVGYSVRALAEAAGLTQQHLARRLPPVHADDDLVLTAFRIPELIALADVFGVSLLDILQRAGVVPHVSDDDVEALIQKNHRLTTEWKSVLKSTYRTAVKDSAR